MLLRWSRCVGECRMRDGIARRRCGAGIGLCRAGDDGVGVESRRWRLRGRGFMSMSVSIWMVVVIVCGDFEGAAGYEAGVWLWV